MKSATESLNKVWNEIASQLYSQAGADQKQQEQPHSAPDDSATGSSDKGKGGDKNVQDASYEVVDDDKK
jgi:hypothetical protein